VVRRKGAVRGRVVSIRRRACRNSPPF
jgi:hypothetical protein